MTQNNSWLPQDYEVPQSASKYMKIEQGQNKIRVLDRPVIGYEAWKEVDGKDTPVRFTMADRPTDLSGFRVSKFSGKPQLHHFWAFPVWNYRTKSVEVLQITQQTLQKPLQELWTNPDWGRPDGYDVIISKTGEKLETEYGVQAQPPKAMDPDIMAAWQHVQNNGFDMARIFTNDDPFGNAATGAAEAVAKSAEDVSDFDDPKWDQADDSEIA